DLTLSGKSDWRLPNIKELQSIVDYSKLKPAIDVTYFPNIHTSSNDDYWSSTTNIRDTGFTTYSNSDYAIFVTFRDGNTGYFLKSFGHYARCVRGGQ
ncbi:MAG: DUF1566 domain-containing protein, partial [Proteobacteria bacterium]|nr:DUF1566 domain-containing protein [Pseudomonadota bacterium]